MRAGVRCRVAALCLLVATLVAGCTRPALSRSEYRSRTTGICAEARRSLAALPAPSTAAQIVPTLRRLRSINRRQTERIAQLNPPLGTDKSHDAAVEIGQRTDRAVGRLTKTLAGSAQPAQGLQAQRPFLSAAADREDHRWARLRLQGCTGGASTALARLAAARR